MKIDIRNKEKDTSFFALWFNDSFRKIRLVYTPEQFSDVDLKQYLINKYRKRYITKGRLYNNVTHENTLLSVEEFINMIINNNDYIVSGYGCIFKSQDTFESMAIKAIKILLARRKKYKNTMLTFEEGSYNYNLNNTIQLAYKRGANSYYGVSGQRISNFYNSHIQNSVTLTGRDLITTSISTMESFLGNNNYLKTNDELLEFINNIKYEKVEFNILNYVDVPVSEKELIDYLNTRAIKGFTFDQMILTNIVHTLSPGQRTRVFYKNQLLKLLNNTYFKTRIIEFNKEAEYTEQKEFRKIVTDFVLYNHIYYDRYNRAMYQTRNSVLTVDTDLRY